QTAQGEGQVGGDVLEEAPIEAQHDPVAGPVVEVYQEAVGCREEELLGNQEVEEVEDPQATPVAEKGGGGEAPPEAAVYAAVYPPPDGGGEENQKNKAHQQVLLGGGEEFNLDRWGEEGWEDLPEEIVAEADVEVGKGVAKEKGEKGEAHQHGVGDEGGVGHGEEGAGEVSAPVGGQEDQVEELDGVEDGEDGGQEAG